MTTEEAHTLKQRIDTDEGLKSKRKMLTITSIVMLAIQFTGAKVIEANTLIVKLSFNHQNGVAILLALAICFLLVRYYSYARKYHDELHAIWSSEMMSEGRYFYKSDPSGECEGLLYDLVDKEINLDAIRYDEDSSYDGHQYICKIPFKRYFSISWTAESYENNRRLNIWKKLGVWNYLCVIVDEIKFQGRSFFIHRESLDVVAPYILGFLALFCFFFPEQLRTLIQMIASESFRSA